MNGQNNRYVELAELIQGFLEEIELVPQDELPEAKLIIRKLKRRDCLSQGLTSQDLNCNTESERVVFFEYRPGQGGTELVNPLTSVPLPDGERIIYHVVVFTNTVEDRLKADRLKAEVLAAMKLWLSNRKNNGSDDRRASKIDYRTMLCPMRTASSHKIDIDGKIRVLNNPRPSQSVDPKFAPISSKITTAVYQVRLYDLVCLYNQVGDELFSRNVRYHIRDELNVEPELQHTLREYPADFFDQNNGVALQITDSKLLNRKHQDCLMLEYISKGDISIINGAQTIYTAAQFFYHAPNETELMDFSKVMERAKRDAWVLLRISWPNLPGQCQAEFNQISVALNRQKPIDVMDVEYTCGAVMQINALFEKNKRVKNENLPCFFKLLKRGQNEPGRFQYQLGEFGRIVTAYYHEEPWRARTSSTKDIIKYHKPAEEDELGQGALGIKELMKSIYAPLENAEDVTQVFLEWYTPLNFAAQALKDYEAAYKKYRKMSDKNENVMVILGNGRYYFIAYLVNFINGSLEHKDGSVWSFTSFPGKIDLLAQNQQKFCNLILEYAELMHLFSATFLSKDTRESKVFNSNDFKTKELYHAWCGWRKNNPQAQKWERTTLDLLTGRETQHDSD